MILYRLNGNYILDFLNKQLYLFLVFKYTISQVFIKEVGSHRDKLLILPIIFRAESCDKIILNVWMLRAHKLSQQLRDA